MDSYPLLVAFIAAATIAGILAVAVFAMTLEAARRRTEGTLHLVPYIFLLPTAIVSFTSGRTFEGGILVSDYLAGAGHTVGIGAWITRACSIFLLVSSGERILAYFTNSHLQLDSSRRWAMFAFVTFWATTILMPQLLSANPIFSHESFYSALVGISLILLPQKELLKFFQHAKIACLLFILVSVSLIFIKPKTVLDSYYAGFIPGVPRFSGLAPHSVAMASISQIGLMLLWKHPFKSRFVNFASGLILLASVFMAQSKTVWVTSILCFSILIFLRPTSRSATSFSPPAGGNGRQRQDHQKTAGAPPNLAWRVPVIFGVFLSFGLVAYSAKELLRGFIGSSKLHELSTLTGRDVIWQLATTEWLRNPIFGYGPKIFDEQYRAKVGVSAAYHGHNQLLDTLARSGLTGGAGLALFVFATLWLSIPRLAVDAGFSLAVWLLIVGRGISEVPLAMPGYGLELLAPMLLIAGICGDAPRSDDRTVLVPLRQSAWSGT